MPGTLFVVATPIGNLEDISMRALRVLREAAVIAAEDTRRTAHLLARYGIATPTTSLHAHNEATKVPALLARLERGDHVALVSDAGTPTVSDPGRLLVDAASRAGIKVEPIPGPSAAIAALAVSGFAAESFMFAGFPPVKAKARAKWLERLRRTGGVVVFFEAPHRILSTLEWLKETVGDVRASVGRELTKAHEQLVKGQISAVLQEIGEPRGEFTVVVDIGQTTDIEPATDRSPTAAVDEFYQLTNTTSKTKRAVVAELSQKHGIPANELYRLIEAGKK